jgi:16S rRNA (guanine966-N2)-methyltransferase
VVFVERHPHAARSLQDNLLGLGVTAPHVQQDDVLTWLNRHAERFDIVMMDPPFNQGLLSPVCNALEEHGWLASKAFVYLESEKTQQHLVLPAAWSAYREKTAGQVLYRLVIRREQ